MAHHGVNPFEEINDERSKELNEHFKKANKMPDLAEQLKTMAEQELGATGKFPDGKIDPNDEGEIKFGITILKGNVIIEFGKPVRWFGMTKEQAKDLGEFLIKKSEEI